MNNRISIRLVAFLLTVILTLSLICPAFASDLVIEENEDETAFTNGLTLADVLQVVGMNPEEATGLNTSAYVSDSTLQYFATLINKMSSTSAYRLALEKVYGSALTVENVAASSESIWATLGSDVAGNPSAYAVTRNGNNVIYANKKSMDDVLTLMRFTTTDEQYAQLQSASSPQDLFSQYAAISEENGQGGTYVWTDTSYTGGKQRVLVGDTVLFTVTASLGKKSVEGSYSQKVYPVAEDKVYQDKDSYTVVPGGSVSYSYIGTVLEVDSNGARAAMGTVDLSGLGAVGDAYRGAMESGQQVVSGTVDSNGNIKYEVPAEPEWNITVSTIFSHNAVDIQAIVLSALKLITDKYGNVITDENGIPLTVDCNEDEFVAAALRMGYYGSEEEATINFRYARTDYVVSYMEDILGYPPSFAVAMAAVMNHESGGFMGPEALQNGKGPGRGLCQWEDHNLLQGASGRYNNGVAWCAENGYDMNTLDGQLQFLNHELLTDYTSVLTDCMTLYVNDYASCVKLIVERYEIPASAVGEYSEILNGRDGLGTDYKYAYTEKAFIWMHIQEEYSDVINGGGVVSQKPDRELDPEETPYPEETPDYGERPNPEATPNPNGGSSPDIGTNAGTGDSSGTGSTSPNNSYKVAPGDTIATIAHSQYNDYITSQGWFTWDTAGEYRIDQAIAEINNRYVDEHPDSGYSKIDTSSYYPVIKSDQTIYIPTIEEICEELGCSPNG